MEKPFQNWTRDSAQLIGVVNLQVDYTMPVGCVRAKLHEIVRASKLWDGQVVNLQVTDFKDKTIELRMLVSAGTSGQVWDLRCEVREKMLAFLQEDHPTHLPRQRVELMKSQHQNEERCHGSQEWRPVQPRSRVRRS